MTPSAFTLIAPPTLDELRDALEQAVAVGGNNTAAARQDEMTTSALALLGYASNRLVSIAVCAHATQTFSVDIARHGPNGFMREILDELRAVTAGAIRLACRALEVHARDGGYRPDEWRLNAVDTTDVLLTHAHGDARENPPHPVNVVQDAAEALSDAATATQSSPFIVAERISDAVGLLLAVYLLARDLRRRPT